MTDETNTTPQETQDRVISTRAKRKGRKAVEKKAKQLSRLEVQYVDLGAVTPNSYNPNRQSDHDFELLLRSMEEDGFTQPIIVNQDMTIVDGEHRWRAAAALGIDQIPIVVVDMSDEQMRISTIRHNRARGSHDVDLEAQVLRDLQELGATEWAQDSLMMDDAEMNRLLDDIAAPEALADEEFSEAWVPDKFTEEERELIAHGSSEGVEQETRHGTLVRSMTPQALETQRRREELIKEAKTEQDRQAVKKETEIYRVSAVFTADEAVVVRQVLGTTPAERILAMCRKEAGE